LGLLQVSVEGYNFTVILHDGTETPGKGRKAKYLINRKRGERMKSPNPVRIYTYLRKIDKAPTINELKDVFKITYGRMHHALVKAVRSKLVLRVFFNGKLYYSNSGASTNPIFYPNAIYEDPSEPEPIQVSDFLKLLESKPKKSRIRKLREKLADLFLGIVWRIVDLIAPDYYVGWNAW